MPWSVDEITLIGLDPAGSLGDIVTLVVDTPAGRIQLMGEVEIEGRILVCRAVHAQSEMGANVMGPANLRVLAAKVLKEIDCDGARVEGAVWTTGAAAGRKPGIVWFSRRHRDSAGSRAVEGEDD